MIRLSSEFCLENSAGRSFSFVNLYSYSVLRKSAGKYLIDGWYSDGIALCVISYLLGRKVKRYSFDSTSIAPAVFNYAREHNLKLAIVGSGDSEIAKFCERITQSYSVDIVYARNGFFNEKSYADSIRRIAEIGPDILICGMGSGPQEEFLTSLRKHGWSGIGFTCGGFIHQSSINGMNYYPEIIDKYNLRFLYRFFKEKHTRKRYLIDYPIGLFYFIVDSFGRGK